MYSSAGTTSVTADVNPASGPTSGRYGIVGGTLTGTATLSAQRGYFSSGTITGGVTLRLTETSDKAGASTLNMNGGTLRNEGTFTCAAGADFNLDSNNTAGAGTIVNHGTYSGGCLYTTVGPWRKD